MRAMTFGKGRRKPSPSTVKESGEDAMARIDGEKKYWDEDKRRGTYSRSKRDKIEKKVGRA